MENKVFNFFRFEDLRIYHKALDYSHWVDEQVKQIEPGVVSEQFAKWFSKAAMHIAVNIAEGSGRNKSQFVYYLKMAKSCVRECVVYTTIGLNENYLSPEKHDESRSVLIEISKMVGALISSLQKGKPKDENDEFGEHPDMDDTPLTSDDEFDL
jgi:four helix bundle protein